MQIYEIAEFLGFESQYYFSKFFKKRTGVSPLAWRKLYQSVNK
jgi:two-component system response regulator YesN